MSLPLFSFFDFYIYFKEGLKGSKSLNGNFGVVYDILDSESLFNTSFFCNQFSCISKALYVIHENYWKCLERVMEKSPAKPWLTEGVNMTSLHTHQFIRVYCNIYFKKSSKRQKIIKYNILLTPCTCKK